MAKKKSDSKKSTVIDMDMFCRANEALMIERSKTMLPLTPALDYRLGGGILEGSFVLIRGKAKTGKTLTAMELVVNALKQNRWVIYYDTENRLTPSKYFIVDGIDILNHPKFLLMSAGSNKKDPSKPVSGEEMYGNIIKMMKIPKYHGALVVVDSLSNVVSKDVIDDEQVSAQRRDSTPKLNADFCKKVTPFLKSSNTILVGIQHMQKSMDPNLHGKLLPIGGDRLEYTADIVLECKHSPLTLEGENVSKGYKKGDSQSEGLMIRYDIPYNRLLGPYVAQEADDKVQTYYQFGYGCWKSKELFFVLSDLGLLSRGGAYYQFMTEKISKKVQGGAAAMEIIDENVDYFESVLRDYYKTEYEINYDYTPYEDTKEESDDEGN
jgi:RecA/RadA recombinase